jgi:hypothetical protein
MSERLFINIAVLLVSVSSDAEEPVVKARTRREIVRLVGGDDQEYSVYSVRFEAIVRNESPATILLAQEPIVPVRVDRLLDDGKWITLLTSSWYDTDDVQKSGCSSVRPKGTFLLRQVTADFALRKAEAPKDRKVVLKFYFETICRHGGQRPRQEFVTDPVDLNLP